MKGGRFPLFDGKTEVLKAQQTIGVRNTHKQIAALRSQ